MCVCVRARARACMCVCVRACTREISGLDILQRQFVENRGLVYHDNRSVRNRATTVCVCVRARVCVCVCVRARARAYLLARTLARVMS